jgi:hypothetical protein
MKKVILFGVALVFSMSIYSQTRTRDAFEIKRSVLFSDGSLDEYTTTEWDSGYTRKDNEIRYSASGAMLEQVEYAYNEDKGYLTTKITRDVESRLKGRTVYQYNNQSQLFRESLVDNKGKVSSTREYAYDAKGNQISMILKNRTGNKMAEITYTYDSSGKMITAETKDAGDRKISSTKYTYDREGNLVNQQTTNPEGRITMVINSVFQAGREVKYEQVSPDGSVQIRITNEYGRDGELTKRTTENFQGESKQFTEYLYFFRAARRQS